jgi:hypothetical protein
MMSLSQKRSHLAGPRSKRAFIGGSRLGFEGVTATTPEDGCHLDGRDGLVSAICCPPTWTCETSLPVHMEGPKWGATGVAKVLEDLFPPELLTQLTAQEPHPE